jgi:glycosyltransferase involved in cell wall biosynthesis
MIGTFSPDHPYCVQLTTMVRQLGLTHRVSFAGRISDAELISEFERAHILLMPSRWEGLGLAAAEAAFLNLPVIASKIGGLPEVVVDNVSGILVSPATDRNFAEAIQRMTSTQASYDRFVEGCVGAGDRFSSEAEFCTKAVDLFPSFCRRQGASDVA